MICKASLPAMSALALSLLFAAPSAAQTTHKNEEIGYQIRLPRDFDSEGGGRSGRDIFLVDRFRCSKPLHTGGGGEFYRRLSVYFFPDLSSAELAERYGAEEEEGEDEGEGGRGGRRGRGDDEEMKFFRSFEEYAKSEIRGFFFSSEEELKVAGFPATVYGMQFEKGGGTEREYVACAFDTPGGQLALMFTCTEQHIRSSRSEFNRTFESLKVINDQGLQPPEPTGRGEGRRARGGENSREPDGLTAEEMDAWREAETERAFDAAAEKLGEEYRQIKGKNFLVLHNGPPSHAKKVLKQAEALRGWLDDNFAPYGTGYNYPAVIVVNEPEDTSRGGGRGGGGGGGGGGRGGGGRGGGFGQGQVTSGPNELVPEITVTRSPRRGQAGETSSINIPYLETWFGQRNRQLWQRMPGWLKTGLQAMVRSADLKGSRLSMEPDAQEKGFIDYLVEAQVEFEKNGKKGDAPWQPVRDVMTQAADMGGMRRMGASAIQSVCVVRYLFEGPGKKSAKTREVIAHYLGNLQEAVVAQEELLAEQREAEEREEATKPEMTEEQRLEAEDEAYRERRESSGSNLEQQLLDDTSAKTFREWTDKDWATLDKAVKRHAKDLAD